MTAKLGGHLSLQDIFGNYILGIIIASTESEMFHSLFQMPWFLCQLGSNFDIELCDDRGLRLQWWNFEHVGRDIVSLIITEIEMVMF